MTLGGLIVLLKSVLNLVTIFYLTFLRILAGIVKLIVCVQCKFL